MQCEFKGAETGHVQLAGGNVMRREGNNHLCSANCLLEGMELYIYKYVSVSFPVPYCGLSTEHSKVRNVLCVTDSVHSSGNC